MNTAEVEVVFPEGSGYEQDLSYAPVTTVGEPAPSSREQDNFPDAGIIVVSAIVLGFYGFAKLIQSSNTLEDR